MAQRPLPWSETCFVCGDANPKGLDAKFQVDDKGKVRLEMIIDPRFEGYGGHVHGGVVTALLDEAAGWAVTHEVGRFAMTIEITVRFRRSVNGGSAVAVTGECLGKEGRFYRARAEMVGAEGKVLASADGRFMPVSEEVHEQVVPSLKMPGRPATDDDI